MFQQLDEVYDWLYEAYGERRIIIYLRLLRLKWSHDEAHNDAIRRFLRVYEKLAHELSASPEAVRRLILADDWRFQLIGNTVAILQQKPEFAADIVSRLLKDRSWIAPQLAAGFALLNTDASNTLHLETNFRRICESDGDNLSSPKRALSIYAALRRVGSPEALELEQSSLFAYLQDADSDDCVERTHHYYHFWKDYPARRDINV